MNNIIEKLGIKTAPWKVGQNLNNDLTVNDNKKDVVCKICPDWLKNQGKNMFNAQLIASAPEMLEALIEELLWMEDIEADNDIAAMRIKSIIEKATGKTWSEIKELLV